VRIAAVLSEGASLTLRSISRLGGMQALVATVISTRPTTTTGGVSSGGGYGH